jgi:hypothetical protein
VVRNFGSSVRRTRVPRMLTSDQLPSNVGAGHRERLAYRAAVFLVAPAAGWGRLATERASQ